MRTAVLLAVLVCIAGVSGCASCIRGVKGVVSSRDYGNGFCSAIVQRDSASDFESIGYFGHCFYRGIDFGSCDSVSVSPSGKVFAWQDGPTGRLKAFSPDWSEPRWLTSEFRGLVSEIKWFESAGEIHVFYDGIIVPHAVPVPTDG
jgi:hypothetical protein